VKDLPLLGFNPYVVAASPYSVSRGVLFLTTKATIDGPRYDTTSWLTLSDFDLRSRAGGNLVLQQLGIPLTMAIALLRDVHGNIDLTVPVVVDERGTRVAIGSIVSDAVVHALVGALSSPLKLLGAVLPSGGAAKPLAPPPIAFRPGTSTLAVAGAEQVHELAVVLASRPGLGVTLSAPTTEADVRALREQALLARLGGPRKGIVGAVRDLGARGRIVDALASRAAGGEASLDPEDAAKLDAWLADVPPPPSETLRGVAAARLTLVAQQLRDEYGIAAEQVAGAPPSEGAAPVPGEPAVRLELGAAGPAS
jgi:hypothetical protein